MLRPGSIASRPPGYFPIGISVVNVSNITDQYFTFKTVAGNRSICQQMRFGSGKIVPDFRLAFMYEDEWKDWSGWVRPPTISELNYRFNTTAIQWGLDATARSTYSIAIGGFSDALSETSVAIGKDAKAQQNRSVSIGTSAVSLNEGEGLLGGNTNDHTHSWYIPGELFVSGLKDFQIPHPHPDKKHTHVIRHGAVESPTAGDTLYRYTIEAVRDNETVKMLLPDYFQYLNKNVDVWVNGHMHFGRAFGIVEDGELKVTCESAGEYKVLVIGTRNDDHQGLQDWDIKGVEREIGELWTGETYVFEDDEIISDQEIVGG